MKKINREAFIEQALDLREFVNDSKSNKVIEELLIRDEDHPRMATRIYECYEWVKSDQYQRIINGTYTLEQRRQLDEKTEAKELLAAELSLEVENDKLSNASIGAKTIDLDLEDSVKIFSQIQFQPSDSW